MASNNTESNFSSTNASYSLDMSTTEPIGLGHFDNRVNPPNYTTAESPSKYMPTPDEFQFVSTAKFDTNTATPTDSHEHHDHLSGESKHTNSYK